MIHRHVNVHVYRKLTFLYMFPFLVGCASKPVIQTQIIEKPVPVYCQVQMPKECKDAYAVDKVSPQDDPVTINRAMRIELEERASCEIKLRLGLKGCNTTPKGTK